MHASKGNNSKINFTFLNDDNKAFKWILIDIFFLKMLMQNYQF